MIFITTIVAVLALLIMITRLSKGLPIRTVVSQFIITWEAQVIHQKTTLNFSSFSFAINDLMFSTYLFNNRDYSSLIILLSIIILNFINYLSFLIKKSTV